MEFIQFFGLRRIADKNADFSRRSVASLVAHEVSATNSIRPKNRLNFFHQIVQDKFTVLPYLRPDPGHGEQRYEVVPIPPLTVEMIAPRCRRVAQRKVWVREQVRHDAGAEPAQFV